MSALAVIADVADLLEDAAYRRNAPPLDQHTLPDLAYQLKGAVAELQRTIDPRKEEAMIDAILEAAAECASAGDTLQRLADRLRRKPK